MKVTIWSDIICPFCYIGKRNFEKALSQFDNQDEIDVEWKSFQLDPGMKSQPGKDIYEYLAEHKGQDREWSLKMHDRLDILARQAGLKYNFASVVIANSLDGHRLIKLASKKLLGGKMQEILFRAYFTDGEDIASHKTLAKLGAEAGLDKKAVAEMLKSDLYHAAVKDDCMEAIRLGARGVPFFVFDNKYGINGAQPSEVFLLTLEKAWMEHETKNPLRARVYEIQQEPAINRFG